MNYAMSTSKDLIIKSAISEFLKFGYKKASLRNIAKGAGLTTGAFYNYFESKLDLFEVLVAPYEKYYLDHCAQVREMLETASFRRQVIRELVIFIIISMIIMIITCCC